MESLEALQETKAGTARQPRSRARTRTHGLRPAPRLPAAPFRTGEPGRQRDGRRRGATEMGRTATTGRRRRPPQQHGRAWRPPLRKDRRRATALARGLETRPSEHTSRRTAHTPTGGCRGGEAPEPGERVRPTPRAPPPRLGGTATGFTGDSFPRTGRARWWPRRQRQQRLELHGSCAQPLLCGLFRAGSPRPGTRYAGRTNAGPSCAAQGRVHSPRQTRRRGRRAHVEAEPCCTAETAQRGRAAQAAAEAELPSGASSRRAGVLGTSFAGDLNTPPRCGRGCAEPVNQPAEPPGQRCSCVAHVATAVSPGISGRLHSSS